MPLGHSLVRVAPLAGLSVVVVETMSAQEYSRSLKYFGQLVANQVLG